VSGFVVRDPALRPSSWRSTGSLEDELERARHDATQAKRDARAAADRREQAAADAATTADALDQARQALAWL